MGAAVAAGRIVGVLILAQMVGSGVANFVGEAPLFGAPGFLVATPLFGGEVEFVLLAPLGASQLILSLWLIARGFRDPAITTRAVDPQPGVP